MKKKFFVLDTNIILHEFNSCFSFQEHDIGIPMETIEEVDNYKKGDGIINFNARAFSRFLDDLPEEQLFDGGAPLGEGLGKIRVLQHFPSNEKVKTIYSKRSVDNQIINTVYCLSNSDEYKTIDVILVSQDVNMRLKAKSLGLKAENYKKDSIPEVKINSFYENVETITVKEEVIENLYQKGKTESPLNLNIKENGFMILNQNTSKTALAVNKSGEFHLISKEKVSSFGIRPKNSEQAFALDVLLDPKISLVTIMGKAGTGKTIVSLAAGLHQLEQKIYDQIYFTRQVIPMGRDIGFLPGDVDEKISPYMQALSDNIGVIKKLSGKDKSNKIDKFKETEKIVIEPLALIRGRNVGGVFFIVDEAQNLTRIEAKTIVTRAAEGTKIILIGDVTQIDHPLLDERTNGLSYVISRFWGQKTYAHVALKKGERSPLAELGGNLL